MISCLPYGDKAILINFPQEISKPVNQQVYALAEALETMAGVKYTIPAYCSLTVGFDPKIISMEFLIENTHQLVRESSKKKKGRKITIPVCYEKEYAVDLEEVGHLLSMSETDIVELHTRDFYQVYMMGFIPGFAYLGKLPEALHCPRKATPRRLVPAQSVGIAGMQTGIYPFDGPGGWQIIGKTPILPFNSSKSNPFIFKNGDEVGFRAIDSKEFKDIATKVAKGIFKDEELYD